MPETPTDKSSPAPKAPLESKLNLFAKLKDETASDVSSKKAPKAPSAAEESEEAEDELGDDSGDAGQDSDDDSEGSAAESDNDEPEDAEEDGVQETGDEAEDSDDDGEADSEEEEGDSDDEDDSDTEESKKEVFVGKTAKGKREIPADLKLKITPDGADKPVEVSMKELVGAYKASDRIQREFSKLDSEKKTFQAEKHEFLQTREDITVVDTTLKKIVDAASNGDLPEVYNLLSIMLGDVDEGKVKTMLTKSREHFDKLDGMSEDERSIYFQRAKLERDKRELDRRKVSTNTEAEQARQQAYVSSLREKHKLSDDEITQAYEKLKVLHPEEVKNWSFEEIANRTAGYAVAWKGVIRIEKVASQVAPKASKAKLDKLVHTLIELKANSLSDSDLKEVARGILGSKKSASGSSEDSEADESDEAEEQKPVKSKKSKSRATAQSVRAEKKTKQRPLTAGVRGFLGVQED